MEPRGFGFGKYWEPTESSSYLPGCLYRYLSDTSTSLLEETRHGYGRVIMERTYNCALEREKAFEILAKDTVPCTPFSLWALKYARSNFPQVPFDASGHLLADDMAWFLEFVYGNYWMADLTYSGPRITRYYLRHFEEDVNRGRAYKVFEADRLEMLISNSHGAFRRLWRKRDKFMILSSLSGSMSACFYGNLDAMEAIMPKEISSELLTRAYTEAGRGKQRDALDWLYKKYGWPECDLEDFAIQAGEEVTEWMIERGYVDERLRRLVAERP